MSTRHLDALLNPGSVAVAGASTRPGSVGATVWRNLRAGGFKGPVYAVNLKHAQVGGEAAWPDPASLPQAPDLAVICTPPDTVAGLVEAFGRRGTRAAIVLTAGLAPAQKQAVLQAAKPYLLRVLGPNCLGLLTPHLGLNASFAHTDALAGDIAFVSQSGALVTAVLDWARTRGIGFSHMISLGESADVDFGDLLDHLASDARTRSILLYVESIQAARKFMSAARAAARNKPVIVVKAGRAGHGVQAAASHTGAMAGSDIVFDAAIRRAGMLRVDSLQDLFMAAETLARLRDNRDDRLTIMTNGGGAGVMAADAAAALGVRLHDLGPGLRGQLDAALPPTWSHANPIDIIGDAPAQRYADTLQALLADPAAGTVLFVHAPTAIVRSDDIARTCLPQVREATGRMMACWLGGSAVQAARRLFEEAGVATYDTPEEAVRAFAMLGTYRRNQAVLTQVPAACEIEAPDTAAARAIIAAACEQGRTMLDESEAKRVLQAYGIPVVPTLACTATADAAAAAAREVGYPVALKIRSADISHKSDVGGVRLNLEDEAGLRHAADAMLQQVHQARPHARIDGFTVQAMLRRPLAQELIVGASVDPVFGPVLLFGQGGTAVEVIADRAVALPPLNRVLARELISRTRVARLLAGYRDHPPVHMDAVCDTLVALARLLADLPELAELDINPLWADADGVMALDARMRLSAQRPAGAARFAVAPYPAELVESVAWCGQTITLRPIRPEDEPEHRAFLSQVQPQNLRLRFFSAQRELPHSETARLTQIDYTREMAFIAVRGERAGPTQTLGVVRAVCDPDNVEAAFALLVRSDLKRLGLGRLLMTKLLAYLRTLGVQRVTGDVMAGNDAMCRLVTGLGFKRSAAATSECGVLRFTLSLDAGACTPPIPGGSAQATTPPT